MKNKKLPEVKPVKIKPLLGMKPGAWLFVCYLIVTIMLVFAIGFLPGIIDGYMRITFDNSLVSRTAVYIDDNYYGSTPFTINVGSGKHNVKYKMGSNVIDEFNINVAHPLFFTWLFPRTSEILRDAPVTAEALDEVTREFFSNVTTYSAIHSYDNVYKYPPLFVEYANTVKGNENSNKMMLYAIQFITTKEMLEDAKKGFEILGIKYDFSKIEKAIENNTFRSSSTSVYGTVNGISELNTSSFTVQGFDYGMFNIAALPVNETMYAFFIKAHPEWSKENRQALIEKGLVDEYYLEDVNLSTTVASRKPVRNISFYAAKAFCEWISEETGKDVYLPSELQWTAAASASDPTFTKSITAISSKKGPAGMYGGVWEFTSTYYVPNDNIIESDIQNFLESNNYPCEPVVKGGCYASDMDKITAYTIGIVSPFLCSDYYGFRIAWN